MLWMYWTIQAAALWFLSRHLKTRDSEGVYSMIATSAYLVSLVVGLFSAPFWVQVPIGIVLYRFIMSLGGDADVTQEDSPH